MILFRRVSKYELDEPLIIRTEILGISAAIPGAAGPLVSLRDDGVLVVAPGYYWDGPSGPAIDTRDFMRSSLVHDALYDLMARRLLPRRFRKSADQLLRALSLEDGMPEWRATYVYWAVRIFGWFHLILRKDP